MPIADITLGLAFLAGLASFLSPCVFSLVPAYVGYLGGRSVAGANDENFNRWVTFSHGVAFVLGFSTVFILLGVAASALGGLLYDLSTWIAKIGGVIVIIFGLHMIGVFRIPLLEYDLRPQTTPDRKRGYLASAMMGVFFSAGWSPCVGPILGTILTLSFSSGNISNGLWLLVAYSIGLAIPFLIAALEIGLVTNVIRRYGKVVHYIEIAMGVVLIAIGVLLFFGRFEQIASLGSFFGSIDEVMVGRAILIGIFLALFVGLLPAYLAFRKGRNFFDWWVFGAVLFPVALVVVLLIKPRQEEKQEVKPYSNDEREVTAEG